VNSNQESLLEEFKAVRDEIKQNETRGLQLIIFLFTTTLAATGLVEKDWIPKWLVPLAIQVSLIIGLTMYYSATILRLRLSTYIQVFIEPEVSGLNWEARNSIFSCRRNDDQKRVYRIAYWIYKWFLNVFSILLLAGIVISIKSFFDLNNACFQYIWWVLSTLLVLHIASPYLLVMCIRLPKRHGEFISSWSLIQREENPREPNQ